MGMSFLLRLRPRKWIDPTLVVVVSTPDNGLSEGKMSFGKENKDMSVSEVGAAYVGRSGSVWNKEKETLSV